jgi:hypothetical protein
LEPETILPSTDNVVLGVGPSGGHGGTIASRDRTYAHLEIIAPRYEDSLEVFMHELVGLTKLDGRKHLHHKFRGRCSIYSPLPVLKNGKFRWESCVVICKKNRHLQTKVLLHSRECPASEVRLEGGRARDERTLGFPNILGSSLDVRQDYGEKIRCGPVFFATQFSGLLIANRWCYIAPKITGEKQRSGEGLGVARGDIQERKRGVADGPGVSC